ncbi:MAG: [Fe-Fe] hydrogenase large subunit C-terminal domain-containing protein [Enterocloster bolteae]
MQSAPATAPENMFVVSVMPCTARSTKYSARKWRWTATAMWTSVLTTRELARMDIRQQALIL